MAELDQQTSWSIGLIDLCLNGGNNNNITNGTKLDDIFIPATSATCNPISNYNNTANKQPLDSRIQ